MPDITGQVVILTVSNIGRSAAWYRDLLGFAESGRYRGPDGHTRQVDLEHIASGLQLILVEHHGAAATFDEFRAGLDHLEFLVAERSDLDAWAARLDELAIAHSGVKEPDYNASAMITFRDPDNIQLEFFWRPAGTGASADSAPASRS